MDNQMGPANRNIYYRRLDNARQWAATDTSVNYNRPQFIQNNMVMRSSGGVNLDNSSLIKHWLPLLLCFDDISLGLFVLVPLFRISSLAYFVQNVYKKILHLDSTIVTTLFMDKCYKHI